MKKLLILLFSILISFNSYGLFGLFEDTVCVETDAQERSGILGPSIYLPNETTRFTGKNLCKYENGQNKSKGKVKDGKKNDAWTEWYENGQKKFEGNFSQFGYRKGKWTEWYENGQKKFEGNYDEGYRKGKWTSWHENGMKRWEGNYIITVNSFIYDKPIKDGKWIDWNEKGQIIKESNWKDGKCISGDCPN